MNIDFSKISAAINQKEIIDPRSIFMSLTNKSSKYNGYLRDVQAEVLEQWFIKRNEKDNIIKMNTGSGKTVVGLLILKSCINENKGKCVYVVPDNYLIDQVIKEANDLGISVTKDENDLNFISGNAILIINIHKLINGKSVFGINQRIEIDSVLIDDVHSCLEIAEKKCMIAINKSEHLELYNNVLDIFNDTLSKQNENNFLNIKDGNFASNAMLVPFWEFKNKKTEILKLLKEYASNNTIMFNMPLIEDILELCDCCISYDSVEISTRNLPIHKISSFENANRRIFMSATLDDDSVLIRDFDIDFNIKNIICPKNATDIGDRVIIMPQAINPDITEEEIKLKLKELSKEYRIVVIVPSNKRAEFWDDVSDRTFNSSNIQEINNYNTGLDILINRYDGIDLKDDKCRIIVIDGLPNASTNYEQIKEVMLADSNEILRDKVQKIEQGMGRGIRSNEDYCGIIVMGRELTKFLYDKKIRNYFSTATSKQIEISEILSSNMKEKNLEECIELIKVCLERNEEWVQISKNNLDGLTYNNQINISNRDMEFRKAFNKALSKDYNASIKIINDFINKEPYNNSTKGYDMMILAKYINLVNPQNAQEVLLSAKDKNKNVISPIDGIKYKKIEECREQVTQLVRFLNDNKYESNAYRIEMNSILSELRFDNKYNKFEESMKLLGEYLGFSSERPEKDYGQGGPDNLWGVGENLYYVIECKNESKAQEISKRDCGQLYNSEEWFYREYGKKYRCVPIILHNSNKFSQEASPKDNFRIMDKQHFEKLKNNVEKFCIAICNSNGDFKTPDNIKTQLQSFNLTKDNFIETYTISVK